MKLPFTLRLLYYLMCSNNYHDRTITQSHNRIAIKATYESPNHPTAPSLTIFPIVPSLTVFTFKKGQLKHTRRGTK